MLITLVHNVKSSHLFGGSQTTALLVNSGESNPVNKEALTVIDSGATSEGRIGWSVAGGGQQPY